MIVHALRKTGHAAASRSVGRQEAEDAFGARNQLPGVETFLEIARQVAHFSLPSLSQIVLEGLSPGLVDRIDPCGAKI